MKLLTDAQTTQGFVDMLRRLGWDARTAHEEELGRAADYLIAARARFLGRIFVTFDRLAAESGAQVAREIRDRGGKVLKIHGGPGEAERALGKFYFHLPEWSAFFNRRADGGSGVVVIGGIGRQEKPESIRCFTPSQFLQRTNPNGYEQFEAYLTRRKSRTRKRRARPPTERPAEQVHMDLGSHGDPTDYR